MATQGGKPMKPKKQVALKLKTLTLTLALAAGMSAGTAMGVYKPKAAENDAQKALDFGAGIENFLTDYKAFKTVGTAANATDATGAYIAAKVGATEGIAGKTELNATRFKSLYDSAKDLKNNEGKVSAAMGTASATETSTKITALKAALALMDDDLDATSSGSGSALELLSAISEAVVTADNIKVGGSSQDTLVDGIVAADRNYSTQTLPDGSATAIGQKPLVLAINALNDAIEDVNTLLTNNSLDTAAKRQAFFNYVAAYQDYNAGAIAKKASELYGTVDNTKLSALAKKLVAQFGENTSAQSQTYLTDTVAIQKLATDAKLAEVAGWSDARLMEDVNLAKNAGTDQTELATFFKVALEEADATKKAALVDELAEKLLPNARTGAGLVQVASKAAMNNVGSHIQAVQAGVNSGDDDYVDGNVWLRTNYLHQDVDKKDNAPAYKQKSVGVGIGVDQPLNDAFTMGLSYNFVRSDVDGKDGYLREDDVKSHAFAGYISMMHDDLFADAQVSYTKNKVDGFHRVTTAAQKVKYNYDGDSIAAMIGVGMHVDLENHWYAKPKLCFAFANHKSDAYDEKNSTFAATDIKIDSFQSSELGLQLTVGADLMMDNYKLVPKFNCGFMYDLNDKKAKSTFKFLGVDNFVAEGPKRDRSNFNVGLGAGFVMDKVAVNLDYGFNWSSNTKTHLVSAKVGYMF